MSDTISTASLDLKIEQITAQMGISRAALTLSHSEDMLTDMVLLQLVRKVVTVPGDEEIRVPATWMDGLKEAEVRRSPVMRWWVTHRPIRYRTWRAMEVLPRFPDLDRYRDTVRIVRLVPSWDSYE